MTEGTWSNTGGLKLTSEDILSMMERLEKMSPKELGYRGMKIMERNNG